MQLDSLQNDLVVASGTMVEIHGHTDAAGNADANMALSEQRAFAVKKWLEGRAPASFPEGRIKVVAHGPMTGEGALSALDGYVVEGQGRTREVLGEAESRIAKLTAEIAEVRRLMDVQVTAQQELSRAATTEKARVRAVLDFFASGSASAGRAAPRPGDAAPAARLVRLK